MLNVFMGNLTPELLIMRLIAVIIGLTVHEFSHGFASYLLGDRTAKHDGRLSLNPIRHIDPLGMALIMIFGFGWAKPVMVNPYNLKKPKRDMAIISIAGPLSNFIVAFIATLAFAFMFVFTSANSMVMELVFTIIIINIVLGVFNLIPIPPLDGSKILALFLPPHLYWRYTGFRHGFILVIILIATPISSWIIEPVLMAIYSGFSTVAVRIVMLFL